MVQDQGIDVYLAIFSDNSKRYKECSVPTTSPSFTGDANEVYIEAVDGERFVVVVDTWQKSDVEGNERLKISCQIDSVDDSTGPWECGFAHRWMAPFGSTMEGRYVHSDCQRQIQGQGKVNCGYVFVPLQIGNGELSQDEVKRSVADYGKVVIKIWRSSLKRSGPLLTKAYVPNKMVSSKAVIVDSHVSHTIGYDDVTPSERYYNKYTFESIEGRHEVPITFTIRCRSRDALRKLKIIANDVPDIDLTAGQEISSHGTLKPDSNQKKLRTIMKSVETGEEHVVIKLNRGRECVVPASYKTVMPADIDTMSEYESSDKSDDEIQATNAPAPAHSLAAPQPPRSAQRSVIDASQVNQSNSAAALLPNTAATKSLLSSSNERIKKRRALEDALEDIKFEQRERRVQRHLARLEEDVE